ncbi:reverse transcriptase domain-containing protein [Tanacetum coccineum]
MPPRMRIRSAGRPVPESQGGGMGEWVGRGRRGREPRGGNDERVNELNGPRNNQGDGANGNIEGVNGENVRNVLVNSNRVGCSYKEFLACNPKEYDGKGGVVVLTRWIEKMKSVQDMSGCSIDQKVKYTAGLFVGKALTWWNSQIRTLSREVAVSMSWNDFKFMMIEEFCPSHEMQKLETELWNHVMVGAGHAAYTDIFHELDRLVPHLVTPESRKINRYVYGIAPATTEPKTMQKVVQISGAQTDEAVRNGSIKKVKKRGNMGEPIKDKNGRYDNKMTGTENAFATTVNLIGRENMGVWPKFTRRHPEVRYIKIKYLHIKEHIIQEKNNNQAQSVKCALHLPFVRLTYLQVKDSQNRINSTNYDPMDDEPMWAADRVVASTPGSAITIPETVNEFAIKDTKNEVVRLMMFPLSLTGEAKTWLDELNEDLLKHGMKLQLFSLAFFSQLLFGPSPGEIRVFSQHEMFLNRSLGFSKGNALKLPWSQSFQRQHYKNIHHGLSETRSSELPLLCLTLKMDAQYQKLQSNSKKTKPDLDEDDIPMSHEKEVKRNDYNRDNYRSNTDDKSYDLQKQFNDFLKSQQSTNAFVKETFMDLKTQLKTVAKNHQASIQNLETKFDRLVDKQSGRPYGSLPSNTQPNPTEHNCNAYQPPQSRNEHLHKAVGITVALIKVSAAQEESSVASATLLQPGEYDLWKMRMEQYLQCVNYTLWEIIENVNAPIVTKTFNGKETAIPPTSVEEKAQSRAELKERSTLLLKIDLEGTQESRQQKQGAYKKAVAIEEYYFKCLCLSFKKPTVETNEPETARKENGAPIIEDWVSDIDKENVHKVKTVKMFNKPSFAKINFVKSTEQVKSSRKTSVDKNWQNTPSPRGNKRNWNQQMS